MKNELENLRFNLSRKTQDLIIQNLIIKQMLEEENLDNKKKNF